MKKILLLSVLAGCFSSLMAQDSQSYTFDWSRPGSLTPAYPAPTADNRYGEYISNVTFTSGPVELTIDDSSVKEQSQRARFLYGYNTQVVEMRAYVMSSIIISVPETENIVSVSFEGAKVTDQQLTYGGTYGTFKGSTWSVKEGESVHQVEFDVDATINCTATTVTISTAGADDVFAESASTPGEWFTLEGIRLPARPDVPGLYIVRNGSKTVKVRI